MRTTQMGQQGLTGWRVKVGDPIAEQVALRTRFTADQVRAVIGAAFFLSSLVYVVQTARGALKAR